MKKKNSKHTFFDDFSELDDYDEYDESDDVKEEETLGNAIVKDFSDVSYDDFNKAIDVNDDDDDDYDEFAEEDDDDDDEEQDKVRVVRKRSSKTDDGDMINAQLLVLLNNFWLVFRVIGIVLAVVLFFYFLINGRIGDLFSYLLLLAGSFIFGFVFMYFVNKLMES